MKKYFIYILLLLGATELSAQYISHVFEYVPAPGQYINTSWGDHRSAESIIGGISGTMSLGAFGGYVVFGFDNPVKNDPANPYGVDFTIFGNGSADWSEPGVVSVMKDENKNGLADDLWYELAGSDHYFSSSNLAYEVTYTNPDGTSSRDVPWANNIEENGFISANIFHEQAYYPSFENFPEISREKYSLNGTLIQPFIDSSNIGMIKSMARAFGYADNLIIGRAPYDVPDNPYTAELENSGGDGFDISWARDQSGKYIDLDEIDFIRVQNAAMKSAGTLGYISTEIRGAIDVGPGETKGGETEMIVMKDLPRTIDASPYQLEAKVFTQGRLITAADIIWQTNQTEAIISKAGLLSAQQSGKLIITAIYANNQSISASMTTLVDPALSSVNQKEISFKLYPNPASDIIILESSENGAYAIMDIAGKIQLNGNIYNKQERIAIEMLPDGLYILSIKTSSGIQTEKFIVAHR